MAGHSLVAVSLPIMALLFGFGHSTNEIESKCHYTISPRSSSLLVLHCTNITDFPKDINHTTDSLLIMDSKLNGASFEKIVALPMLKILEIYDSKLKNFTFKNLNLPVNLNQLKIHNSNLKNIERFRLNEKLNILDITLSRNKLKIAPEAFDNLSHLSHLVLNHNQLDSFPVFKRRNKLRELYLRNNNIKQLKRDDLIHLGCLEKLDLTNNPIESIHSDAFKNLVSLKILVLDGSEIETLPTKGLQKLTDLSLENVHTLLRIPEGLRGIRTVKLAEDKSFLCCQLKFQTRTNDGVSPVTLAPMLAITEGSTHPTSRPNRFTTGNMTIPPGFGKKKRAVPGRVITFPPSHTPNTSVPFHSVPPLTPLNCTPVPTPFQPCEDIMGADWLMAVSFIVAPFALCGNFVVIVVFLCMARNYNVSRFLVTNLAIADMSMGIYLLSLVIESVITSGEYYKHVERFQLGTNCKVLGFLAMFSSELSVFALTLITVERYMTIVYAMYPKRRLSMRTAVLCMGVGWMVAITLAILPIVGVGSYSKVAICLPFETQNGGDLYLFFIFGLNGVSFVFICALYAQIYRSVFKTNNSTPTRGHDSRVARRMAILVFTDFACFAPIAVAGLSAMLGHALIDVKQSKYLLVFFFPLNGLLNPFLYAIITKTFRRDLAALLKNCFVCGGTLTNYLSNFPARSVQSTNDAISPSARPSLDFNAMGFHSMGNIRGSRENPISASFSKSEPNLVKFIQDAEQDQ